MRKQKVSIRPFLICALIASIAIASFSFFNITPVGKQILRKPVVVVIHGTFARNSRWMQSEIDIARSRFEEAKKNFHANQSPRTDKILRDTQEKLNALLFMEEESEVKSSSEHVESSEEEIALPPLLLHETSTKKPRITFFDVVKQAFSRADVVRHDWSGQLSSNARIVAGITLAARLVAEFSKRPIILIGHSHGGNIIKIAINILALLNQKIALEEAGPLAKNTQNKLDRQKLALIPEVSHNQLVAIRYHITQALNQQENKELFDAAMLLKKEFAKRSAKENATPLHVHAAITLGTPMAEGFSFNTTPENGTITHAITISSKGDSVQAAAGYRKALGYGPVTNLFLSLQDPNGIIYSPGHRETHHPRVGLFIKALLTALDKQLVLPPVCNVTIFNNQTAIIKEYMTNNSLIKRAREEGVPIKDLKIKETVLKFF